MNWERFVEAARKSSNILIKNLKKLWIGVAVESFFLLTLGFFLGLIRPGILANLEKLGGVMISEWKSIGKGFLGAVLGSENFRNIVLLSMLLALTAYAIYCAFHGFIWRFCFNFEKKRRYNPYMKRFFQVNILWIVLYAVYFLLNFFFSYTDFANNRLYPGQYMAVAPFTNILLVVIMYFAFLSYVMIDKYKAWKSIRKSFSIGTKKLLWIASAYLVIWALSIVLNYPLVLAEGVSKGLMIALGIALIMPLMLWSRIFLKKVVDAI